MIARRAPRSLRLPLRGLFLALVILFVLLPVVWTALASLGILPADESSSPAWNFQPSLDHFQEIGIAEPQFITELLTSSALAACVTLLTISVAFITAYRIAHSRFRRRNLVVQSFLILASLPVISYVISLRSTLMFLRLFDTFIGVALAEAALYTPLAIYVLYGYLSALPTEFEEAAQIDGATLAQTLRRIVIPTAAPGIAATAIIIFVLSWNQVLIPLVLAERLKTIPVAMIDFFTFERELEWPTAAAALIASLLPIGLFVAITQPLLERFHLGIVEQVD